MAQKTSTKSEKTSTVSYSPDELTGVALIEKAIEVLGALPGRLLDNEGHPGGLILFSETMRPIIIGDLHSNTENLSLILNHESNKKDIESGKAACILLGDSLHDDRTGHMKDMKTSIDALDAVLHLIIKYPGQIYYIRGNHDTFDERLRKSGISQGIEMKTALLKEKGREFTDKIEQFFESLPVFIIGNTYVITHAGPPHGGVSRDELINITKHPETLHQLLWNRVNEFHGNPSLKEYGEKDIRLALNILNLPPDTHFIVGHNPIWSDGNKIGFWQNILGIKNHHILYSGYGSAAPYITFINGEMKVKTAAVEKPEVYYYG